MRAELNGGSVEHEGSVKRVELNGVQIHVQHVNDTVN